MELLGALVEVLGVTADWSVGCVKESDGLANVHLAFANKGDAFRVAAALQASPIGRYPGWASQREFLLNTRAEEMITATLARLPAKKSGG